MFDAAEQLAVHKIPMKRFMLIGGAAKSQAVAKITAGIFGGKITLPDPNEYVANGAARQAAWLLLGGSKPPMWRVESAEIDTPPTVRLLEEYLLLKEQTSDWY
jgi:xylulokinase